MSFTLIIVLVTGLISYQCFNNRNLFNQLKHYPVAEAKNNEFHRFLSSGFVHGSWMHLLINMYVLWTFGEQIETRFNQLFGNFGRLLYVMFYVSAIVVADIPSYLRHKNNPGFASVGASGAVSAIVFVYIVFFPWQELMFVFFPFFGFPAIVLGIGYLIYSSWASNNRQDGIDHLAHFSGAMYGLLFIFIAKPSLLPQFLTSLKDGLPF